MSILSPLYRLYDIGAKNTFRTMGYVNIESEARIFLNILSDYFIVL